MSRVLITGLSSYWGGRLAQELERDEDGRGDRRRRHRGPDARARAHRVRPRRHPARAAAPDRARRRDRHGDRHPPDRRLRHRAAARRPRAQRDRDDEHPRRLRWAGLAGDEGRLQVQRPLLRLRARRPVVLHRGDAAPARAAHPPGVRHRRGRRRRPGLRRAQPARHGHHAALLQRARAGPGDVATARCWACRRCPASSASTRATSSSTRTTSSACCTTRPPTTLPGIHNAAPDGVLALSEIASLLGKPFAPILPPLGTAVATRLSGLIGLHIPDEVRRQLRYGRGSGQPQAQAVGLPIQPHDARNNPGICRGAAAETASRERRGAISLRARGGGIPPLVAKRAA